MPSADTDDKVTHPSTQPTTHVLFFSIFCICICIFLYRPEFYWYLPIVPIITHNSLFCNNIWQYWSLLYPKIPKKRGGLNECGGTWCQLQLPFNCTLLQYRYLDSLTLGIKSCFYSKNVPLNFFSKCFVAKFNHAGQSLASHLHVESLPWRIHPESWNAEKWL